MDFSALLKQAYSLLWLIFCPHWCDNAPTQKATRHILSDQIVTLSQIESHLW